MSRSAPDGLPLRPGGAWSVEKLIYVERYAAAFTRAMKGKWDRLVYIDLLAGPGKGVRRDTGVEFDGSPLRALKVKPPFDHLYLADVGRKVVNALERRISESDRGRVSLFHGDCNDLADRVVAQLTGRTLGLAFVDPTGFEAKFPMFQAFARRQIDVLFFFPDQIGIVRNLAQFATRSGALMDGLMGDDSWRQTPQARLAGGHPLTPLESRDLARSWVSRFQANMATIGYRHYDHAEPVFRNRRNARMYHLLFFSRNALGLKIWRGIKRIQPDNQRLLSL
jgi:three-Cys-motif partner protein